MIKIDSTLIVKNEQDNIKKLILQLLEFSSEVHVTDTGSTDDTIKIIEALQKKNDNLFLHHFEWIMDFAAAKNYSLDYENNTSDFQFWCDADDLLNDKLIETLKWFRDQDVPVDQLDDIYYMKYKYFFGDNNPYIRTSLLKTIDHFRWKDPIHEFIVIDNTKQYKLNFNLFYNESYILHQKELAPSDHNRRNLEIFQNMELTGREFSPRNYYYYAQELNSAGFKKLAASMYKNCIYTAQEVFDPQDLCNSCIQLYFFDNEKFIDHALYVMKKGVCRGDLLYYMGNYFLDRHMYWIAVTYFNAALTHFNTPDAKFGMQEMNVTINPLLQLGVIYANVFNDLGKALEYNGKVLEYDPQNSIAQNNINIIHDIFAKNEKENAKQD